MDWKEFCNRLQSVIARPFNECEIKLDLNQYQQEVIDKIYRVSREEKEGHVLNQTFLWLGPLKWLKPAGSQFEK